MRQNILVTGGTGRLGGLVATTLRDEYSVKPRVLVRKASLRRTESSAFEGMGVVTGDYKESVTLEAALDDVDAVFLVSPVHPEMVCRETALAKCAARMPNPPHIVKISGLGTSLDSFVDSGRWQAQIECDIREMGVPETFLRPLFFMQNLAFQARAMMSQGVLHGGVQDAQIAMIDARDITDVAARVLTGGSGIDGQAVTLTGAHAYSYSDVAEMASRVFNRPIEYHRQSLKQVRQALEKSGQPEWHINILLQFNEAFMQGWGATVSDTVSSVLTREPRSLEAYFSELAEGASATGSDPFPST